MTARLLEDDHLLRHLYPAELFPAALIRGLGVIPTEYLFFYYNQTLARDNQLRAGVTRGEELEHAESPRWRLTSAATFTQAMRQRALEAYRRYLNRRNASYMKLEGAGDRPSMVRIRTGIRLRARPAITASRWMRLRARQAPRLMHGSECPNHGAIEGLEAEDSSKFLASSITSGPRPLPSGFLPNQFGD